VTRPEAIQPADASATVFYFTNAYNTIIGNAAVGGWSGIFAKWLKSNLVVLTLIGMGFINLPTPIGSHTSVDLVPMERPTLVFDGNTGTWLRSLCINHVCVSFCAFT